MLTKQSNPRLLSLLQMGCTVTFPDGRGMAGITDTGYIQISRDGQSLGLWNLDREGLRNALADRDFQSQEQE